MLHEHDFRGMVDAFGQVDHLEFRAAGYADVGHEEDFCHWDALLANAASPSPRKSQAKNPFSPVCTLPIGSCTQAATTTARSK